MKSRINFAAGECKKIYRIKLMFITAICFFFILGILELHFYKLNRSAKSALSVESSLLGKKRVETQRRLSKIGLKPEDIPARLKKFESEAKNVNEIISRKVFSWTGFLYGIEQLTPEELKIERITASADAGKVTMEGKANTMKEITLFTAALENSDMAESPFLKESNLEKDNNIKFALEFKIKNIKTGK